MATIDPYVLKHLSHMQPALYWLDEDPLEPQPNPTLIGDVTTDLCVVGAGYTGLWTALIAKEQNPEREVIIVEQRETGAGASGRNGGFFLLTGFVCRIDTLACIRCRCQSSHLCRLFERC